MPYQQFRQQKTLESYQKRQEAPTLNKDFSSRELTSQRFSKRYLLQNPDSFYDYNDNWADEDNNNAGFAFEGRESFPPQFHNFGGWPNGFNNEDGWGGPSFFTGQTKVDNDQQQQQQPPSYIEKSYEDNPTGIAYFSNHEQMKQPGRRASRTTTQKFGNVVSNTETRCTN